MSGDDAIVREDAQPEVESVEETSEVEQTGEESETPEGDTEEETEAKAEEEPEEKPKRKRVSASKRISQLTWKTRQQERELAELRSQVQATRPEETPPEFPTLESVGYDEGRFQQEVQAYMKATAGSQVREAMSSEREAEQARQAQDTRQEQVDSFFERGLELDEGFVDLITDENLPITQEMTDTLIAIEAGPEVTVHLAQNPEEAARISRLSPIQQTVEITRLEGKLTSPRAKQTTNAPPPLKPVSASGETLQKDPDKMSVEEWNAWRNSQIQAKQRR